MTLFGESIFSWDYVRAHNEHLIFAMVVLAVAFVSSWFFRAALARYIDLSTEKLSIDATRLRFLKNAIPVVIFFLAVVVIIYSIPSLKTISVSLFAGAGVLAIIIGFASQAAFANIISGIFIVFSKPFRVNDRVQVGSEYSGVVEDITLRHTIIRSYKNERIIIPNSVINTQTLINSTYKDDTICNYLDFNIAYDSNIDLAVEIIRQEAEKHPDMLDNRSQAETDAMLSPVDILLIGFSENAMQLRAYVWSKNPGTGYAMLSDLRRAVKLRFDKEGIEIPHAYLVTGHKR
jgi:small-conductance mechanosensitive channel